MTWLVSNTHTHCLKLIKPSHDKVSKSNLKIILNLKLYLHTFRYLKRQEQTILYFTITQGEHSNNGNDRTVIPSLYCGVFHNILCFKPSELPFCSPLSCNWKKKACPESTCFPVYSVPKSFWMILTGSHRSEASLRRRWVSLQERNPNQPSAFKHFIIGSELCSRGWHYPIFQDRLLC